jgi:hypothetical protein
MWPVVARAQQPARSARTGSTTRSRTAPRSDFYRDLLPLLNSGRAELLEHAKLAAQLCCL